MSAAPQNVRPDLNRKRTFDVEHYVLRTSFDPAKRTVFGETSIRLTPLDTPIDVVELDAEALRVESVVLESSNSVLAFKNGSGKLVINLDRTYRAGELVTIRVKHSATPNKGVYFVEEKRQDGRLVHPAQIWTQGEPDEARHWFPLFDFPSDKATTEQFIRVASNQTVISNGELVSKIDNKDGTTTFHYSMTVPHSAYLISFVVGDYVKVEDKYRNIPLGYYVYRGRESIVPLAYGKTKEMMRIFEELTKVDYPYNKYDQTIVANFTFGGMENITATTMADSEIFYASVPFLQGAVEDLVSHELAHSWFGNLVTCKNWAELWLNEGFATFMEAAVREKLYGRKDYIRKILVDAENFIIDDTVGKKRFGLFNQEAGNVAALFDRPAITYNKG
ncbi:MAG: M1 family metallopeptidase, partial [Pyrinomonadaceae bacterium]|nr:M1 family metallopeptidase [Pyrinomonadaceae bacterium]